MALHGIRQSVTGSLDVRVACAYAFFMAIAMNVLFAALTQD
jgi:hypothetical protein